MEWGFSNNQKNRILPRKRRQTARDCDLELVWCGPCYNSYMKDPHSLLIGNRQQAMHRQQWSWRYDSIINEICLMIKASRMFMDFWYCLKRFEELPPCILWKDSLTPRTPVEPGGAIPIHRSGWGGKGWIANTLKLRYQQDLQLEYPSIGLGKIYRKRRFFDDP